MGTNIHFTSPRGLWWASPAADVTNEMRKVVKDQDRDTKILLRSRITDLGSHLRITVAPEEDNATDGTLSTITKATLSSSYDKPVLFIMNGGARKEFWTNGYLHCPWCESVRVYTPNRDITKYTNSAGEPHRIDGPSYTTYILDPREERYEELWHHDGKLHRDGGPAMINIIRAASKKTWGDVSSVHAKSLVGMFPYDTPVRYTEIHDKVWYKNAEPYRSDINQPTSIRETGVSEVIQLSNSLGVKNTKFCIRKEYAWRDTSGLLSRTNGPAVVKLLGSLEVTQRGNLIREEYDSALYGWWHNGVEIPVHTVNVWMSNNGIAMGTAPYIKNPAFNEEDETCFLMDVLQYLND